MKFIITFFSCAFTIFQTLGIELAPNSDLSYFVNHKIKGWKKASGWKGQSTYRSTKGCLVIERNNDDNGAGAYMSDNIPVIGEKNYKFSVTYRCTLLKKNSWCAASVAWYNSSGKQLSATYLFSSKKSCEKNTVSKQVKSPSNAKYAIIRLVLADLGNAEFFKISFDNNVKPSNVILNKVKINNLLPSFNSTKWFAKKNWRGKSIYNSANKILSIVRPESDSGAGAWESVSIKLSGNKTLFVGGKLKTSHVENYADISLIFYNAQKKRLSSEILLKAKGTTKWLNNTKIITVPFAATEVRVLLRVLGKGNAEYKDIFISDQAPEVADNLLQSAYILNGSFEAADLSSDFTDCFVKLKGKVTRSKQAFHGFHALKLAPDSSIAYGAKDALVISVTEKENINLSFATLGLGKAVCKIDFYNSQKKKISTISLTNIPDSKKFIQAKLKITVPEQAIAASLTISNFSRESVIIDALYLGKSQFSFQETATVPFIPKGATADFNKFPKSTLKMLNGRPTWFVNDKPMTQSGYTLSSIRSNSRASWYNYVRRVLQTAQYPFVLLECYLTPEKNGERYTLETVMKDIEVQIKSTLAEIPDAKFMLWVMLEPSFAFAGNYPNDLARLEDTTIPWQRRVPPYSYGSEIWARKCQYALRELISNVSKSSYANKIIAISPGLGMSGENNFGHATTTGRYSPLDFSPVNQDLFRKWLMKEYDNNVLNFQKAWNTKGTFNFTNAQVPGMMRRVPKNKGAFYDPATQMQNIDYVRYESFSILHRVLLMCKTVKEASNNRLFTMAQLAYFTGANYHKEINMALKSPHLDALGPAPPYINRGPGDDIMAHGPNESIAKNNKLWMFQADTRSHLSSAHNWKYGRTANEEESIAIYLRDIGQCMTRGIVPYYMTFERWYDSPGLYALISRFNKFLALGTQFPRQTIAEIAVVVDKMSYAVGHEYSYVRRIMPPFQSSVEYNRTFEWHHIGAPYDFYMLDDLLKLENLKQYKTVIFAANWAMSQEQRKLIEQKLKKDGRTLIWLYTAGLMTTTNNMLKYDLNGTKITGFNFNLSEKYHNLEITLKDGKKAGKFNTKIYGGFRTPQTAIPVRAETFAPRLSVKPDKNVKIFGKYTEDSSPTAAKKKTPTHTDIFWGATALNKEVLIPILKEANVHLYTDKPAVVYASQNILMIHTPIAGKRKILLPQKAECIYDLVNDKILASNVSSLEVSMNKNSTILLYYGNKNQLSKALSKIDNEELKRKLLNQKKIATGKYKYSLPPKAIKGKKADLNKVYNPDKDGFIKDWLFLGPFVGYEKDKYAFDIDYLQGETKNRIYLNKNYTAVFDSVKKGGYNECTEWFNGKKQIKTITFTWQPISFSAGVIKGLYSEIPLPFSSYVCYYLACYVNSPNNRTLRLAIGSDDGEKTFFNGQKITSFFTVSRRLKIDSETGIVNLKPGKNLLLVKVVQGLGGVGHAVRFFDPETNKPVTDIKITLQ